MNIFEKSLEYSVMTLAVLDAQLPVISPVLIVVLCAVAGVGTMLLLPSRREWGIRKIGGAIVLLAAIVFASLLIRFSANAADPMGAYFWIFAAIATFASVRVITHPRPVYAVLYFVLTVFASAGLFVLLWAEFMAAALVLIYAGAILVTYIFVIMLAARSGVGGELTEADTVSREPLAAATLGFGLMALLLYVIFDRAPATLANRAATAAAPADADITVQGLARYLFEHQLINLELAGVILTMAMVGAIIIARRRMWVSEEPIRREHKAEVGDDNPLNLVVAGTRNPRQKQYPES